jgi:hypothetical protein
MSSHANKYETPTESGSYVVTVVQQKAEGRQAFKYVAYYDLNTFSWYKQDNFGDKNKLGDDISLLVSSWQDNETQASGI